MTYTTILAVASFEADAKTVAQAASKLAKQHDALLIARHVIPIVDVTLGYAATFSTEIVKTYQAQLRETAGKIKDIFAEAASNEGVDLEWELEDGVHADPANGIIPRAQTVDLVVIGQPTSEVGVAAYNLTTDVALGCGRPVLVIPKSGVSDTVGKSPLIAWNYSKEAARAASDALPILQAAEEVTVLSVAAASASDTDPTQSAHLSHSLARHGVKTRAAQTYVKGVSVTDELFDTMSEENCDMLVMGAFGHSRFYETVLGGTSKNVMSEMTVPVFVSH